VVQVVRGTWSIIELCPYPSLPSALYPHGPFALCSSSSSNCSSNSSDCSSTRNKCSSNSSFTPPSSVGRFTQDKGWVVIQVLLLVSFISKDSSDSLRIYARGSIMAESTLEV
jgi:hypothetical protein